MSGQIAWVYGLVEHNICKVVTKTSSFNALKASWCYYGPLCDKLASYSIIDKTPTHALFIQHYISLVC